MGESKSGLSYGGPGLLTLLGVLFIGLKLTGYIDWPWWLVLLPLYGGLIVVLLVALIIGIVVIAAKSRK